MAVTYDADAEDVERNVSSYTVSLTVANQTNRYLIVGVVAYDGTAADTIPNTATSKFNEDATFSSIINDTEAATDRTTLLGMVAPDVVTNGNLVIYMGGTCVEMGFNGLSAYNVHQTSSLGTAVSANGTTNNATVNVVAAVNDLVYECTYHWQQTSPNPTVGASQTQRARLQIDGSSNGWLLASTEPGAASVTMSWTLAGTGDREWVICAVALKPIAGGIVRQMMEYHGG